MLGNGNLPQNHLKKLVQTIINYLANLRTKITPTPR